MAQKVFKYEIKPDDIIEIEMPIGSDLLTVQTQGENVCLWALVDTNLSKVKRRFRVYGTGHEIQHEHGTLAYVGTFQLHEGGLLVFHLFEIV